MSDHHPPPTKAMSASSYAADAYTSAPLKAPKESKNPPTGGRSSGSGARACQRCRRNKSKCVLEGSNSVCRRCEEARMDCIFVNPPTPNFSLATGYINGSDFATTVGDTTRKPVPANGVHVEYHSPALGRRPVRADAPGLTEAKLAATHGSEFDYTDNFNNDDSYSDASGRQGSVRPMREAAKRVDMADDSEDFEANHRRRDSSVAVDSAPRFVSASKRRRVEEPSVGTSISVNYASEPSINSQQYAFELFLKNYLPSISFVEVDKFDTVRHQSQVLFWSTIAVGSSQAEDLADIHAFARRKASEAARSTLIGRPPSLEDLKGFIVSHVWLSAIRPVGHLVSLAYELNLHLAHLNLKGRSSAATRSSAKLWAFIVVEDFMASLATGRPRLIIKNDVTTQCEALVRQPTSLVRDYVLLAQAELMIIIDEGKPQTDFDWGCADDYRLLRKTNAKLDEWDLKWRDWAAKATASNSTSPLATVEMHYLFAKVCINSVVLKGMRRTSDVTQHRLIYAYLAVTHAQQLLRVAASYFQSPLIGYTSEYTRFQIAFCAAFLLKVLRLLPSSFEIASLFSDIRDAIALLSPLRHQLYSKGLQVIYNFIEKQISPTADNAYVQTTPAITKAMGDVGLARGWEESYTASWMSDSAVGEFSATLFNPWGMWQGSD